MDLGLNGRVFIVTGGSRGLGLASAQELVANGARVVISARDSEQLATAVESVGGHDNAVGLPVDMADPAGAETLTAAAVARFGRLDGALISVGGPPAGGVLAIADEQWRGAFESIVLGSLRVARAAASAIDRADQGPLGSGGSILFLLSTSVRTPLPGLAISNVLRPGLAGAVKDLADALGPRGVRVNAVMPGRFATDRSFALDASQGSPARVRSRNEAEIPLQRYGEPEEFGKVAAFLLSPAASYVTGAALAADGGSTRTI